MTTDIFSGCIPALMTPCTADRGPNFDALVRRGQELIAAGMTAVIYNSPYYGFATRADLSLVLYYKHLMALNEDCEYALRLNKSDALTDSQCGYAEAQYSLFKAWYQTWTAQSKARI
nr:hypothetical protein [Pseudophaeobacter profundi]